MNLDFSSLGDLAQQDPVKKKSAWEPLRREDLAFGRVVAWDQSFSAPGMVIVIHDESGCQVSYAEKMKPPESLSSAVLKFSRGADLYQDARVVMENFPHFDFVHESPPTPSRLKGDPLSSWCSAQALWCAARAQGVKLAMYSAQSGKKLVCGNGNAKKPEAHKVLKENCFGWIEQAEEKVTNEAERDALMVALVHLHRKKSA